MIRTHAYALRPCEQSLISLTRSLWSIESKPVEAMRALEAMPEVEKTSIFGTAVHAVLRPSAPDVDAVTRKLSSQIDDPVESALVEPSLEDVFLDLVMRTPAPGASPPNAAQGVSAPRGDRGDNP